MRAVEPLVAKDMVRLTLAPITSPFPPLLRVNVRQQDMPGVMRSGAVVQLKARLMPPPPMTVPGATTLPETSGLRAWVRRIALSGRCRSSGGLTICGSILIEACANADLAVSDRWLPRGCEPR